MKEMERILGRRLRLLKIAAVISGAVLVLGIVLPYGLANLILTAAGLLAPEGRNPDSTRAKRQSSLKGVACPNDTWALAVPTKQKAATAVINLQKYRSMIPGWQRIVFLNLFFIFPL